MRFFLWSYEVEIDDQRGTIPSFPASRNLILAWRNVTYEVIKRGKPKKRMFFGDGGLWREEKGKERLRLLNEVSGVTHSGSLMAVMGPSGAGKTTLLAAIARRVRGQVKGEILLNGKPIDWNRMTRISGFVAQRDFAVESLTVQEHMEFMARMKMDRRRGTLERKKRISSLLRELTLANCAESSLSSLSGGERKRVSLAVQLLTEPLILFCDEPTTGLDSYAAHSVTRTLREVASRGKIVLCSLHQPTSGLLDVFNEYLFLCAGRVAFQGSIGEATEFFSSLGIPRSPSSFDTAEFYVSQLSIIRGKEAECEQKIDWICDRFEDSSYGRKRFLLGDSFSCSLEKKVTKDGNGEEFRKIRGITQISWLMWRSFLDYKRNSSAHLLRFVSYVLIGGMISLPYVNVLKNPEQSTVQNLQGLMYLIVVETVFTFNYAVFYTFPRELPLLLRDIASDIYSPAAYYLSKVAILTPVHVLQSFLYATVTFFVTGLRGGINDFGYFALPIVLCAVSASAFGCLLSAAFKSINVASLVSVPIDFLTLMFCGIYLHLGSLPSGFSWLRYLSQFYYGLEAVSLTEWSLIEHLDCSNDPEEPCISTGERVLEKYGYQSNHYVIDVIGLLAIFFVSHFAGYLLIRQRSQREAAY